MGVFFTSVFGTLFGWIANYFTKKIAFGLASMAMFLTLSTAFYTACQALIAGLGGVITNEWLLVGFWSVVPSNTSTCLTICFSAEILGFLYRHQIAVVKAVSSAN
ncbi:MAG: DUF5455 family protein [Sideroxydans sp.]|nr:DUF5455 family protein [Sideroxydans sp.]